MVQTTTQTIVVGGRIRAPLALSNDLVLRGLVAVIAGVVALVWPSGSLVASTVVLGGGAIAVGLCELIDGVRRRHYGVEWGFELLRGLVLVGGGSYLLVVASDITLERLAVVAGSVWSVYGLAEAAEGVRARRGIREARFRVVRGVLVLGAAVAVLAWPDVSTTVLGRSLGAALVAMGVLCVPSALVLRQIGQLQRPIRLDVVR